MNKNYEAAFPGKIALGAAGLGTVNPELLEKRALELAKTDGRLEATEADLAHAEAELLPHGDLVPAAPEIDNPALENLTVWDEPLDARGRGVDQTEPQDDATIAEQLVQEGLSEADHEQRVTASEVDPPEEL